MKHEIRYAIQQLRTLEATHPHYKSYALEVAKALEEMDFQPAKENQ